MVTVVKRRWGIVSVAALMCLTTVLFVGGKGSVYILFWGYAAYLGYKGDIATLATYLKILILLNVIVLLGVLLFVDAKDDLWRWTGWGNSGILAIIVGIPMSVMVGMFAYIRGQLRSLEQFSLAAAGEIRPGLAPTSDRTYPQRPASVTTRKPPTMEDAYNAISPTREVTPSIGASPPTKTLSMEDAYAASTTNLSPPKNIAQAKQNVGTEPSGERDMVASAPTGDANAAEEALWAAALDEFEGPHRRKGLWAKLYAEFDGDDVQLRVAYLKTRFAQLQQELAEAARADDVRLATQERERLRAMSARDCYAKGLYVEFMEEGYDCIHFKNGQAAMRFRDTLKVYASPEALRRHISELAQPHQANATAPIDVFTSV